jgi:type VI secretion system secreted protein VgrG
MDAMQIDDTTGRLTYDLIVEDGLQPHPWSVKRINVSEELSGEYRATLSIENDDSSTDADELLGSSATLVIRRGDGTARPFSGIVRSVVSEGLDRTGRLHGRIVIEPAFKCLDEGIEWNKFVNMTVPEILKTVLVDDLGRFRREVDLRLIREQEKPSSPRRFAMREYTAQRAETRYAFVRRLCSEEGLAISYEQSGTAEKLIITDDNSKFPKLTDAAILDVVSADDAAGPWTIRMFEIERRRIPSKATVKRFDLSRPRAPLLDQAVSPPPDDSESGAPGDHEIYDPAGAITLHDYADGRYKAADTSIQAQLRLEAAQVQGRLGRGQGYVLRFRPGLIFTLDAQAGGISPLDGTYLLTSVRHSGEAPSLGSPDGRSSVPYRNTFTCIPADVPFRPARLPKPHAGFDFAVVAAISDDDPIHQDRQGRVRVKFTWDRSPGDPEHDSSGWVPISQPWAGAGYGIQAVPRKGMVVLIHYEHGDPDRPVIVNAAPTSECFLPFDVNNKATIGIRTQSQRIGDHGFNTPHFNELSLSDAAGRERFFERAGHDYERRVLHDNATTIDHDDTRSVANDQTIAVEGNRTRTVGKNEKVSVKGDRDMTVDGADTAVIRKDVKLTISGGRSTEVQKSELLAVHGDREMNIDGSEQLHVKKDRLATVDGKFTGVQGTTKIECEDGHVDVVAGKWIRVKHGPAEVFLDEDANATITTPKRVTIQGDGASITIDGGKVTITASKELSLGVGDNAIKIDEGGIATSGTNITESATVMHQTTAAIITQN